MHNIFYTNLNLISYLSHVYINVYKINIIDTDMSRVVRQIDRYIKKLL